ncbi:MAG TPA: YjdF family protein [Tissierellales bacterium]|nr:YjdF family protein [Tissierellales bacterium]
MNKVALTLTVYFNGQFWIGIYERVSDGKLEVSKITFGLEPKDYEVYSFILENWRYLRFRLAVEDNTKANTKINLKRMQREINKQLKSKGIGTKSQQALKLQHEQNKLERKAVSKRRKKRKRKFSLN